MYVYFTTHLIPTYMKGRPKKYKDSTRVLLFLNKRTLDRFDTIYSNRSDAINKLLETHLEEKEKNGRVSI